MMIGFVLGFIILGASTIASMVALIFSQHKLYNYLRERHTEKWKYLTTVMGFGPGFANSIKGIEFLLDKDYLGDTQVLKLKILVRNCALFALTGMISLFIVGVLMVLFGSQK